MQIFRELEEKNVPGLRKIENRDVSMGLARIGTVYDDEASLSRRQPWLVYAGLVC